MYHFRCDSYDVEYTVMAESKESALADVEAFLRGRATSDSDEWYTSELESDLAEVRRRYDGTEATAAETGHVMEFEPHQVLVTEVS